jgi:hypothetical protein
MPNPADEAAEQLRAIRALMERSTVYQAVSAPAALFAGLISIAVSGWLWVRRNEPDRPEPVVFLLIWLGVLAVVSVLNTVLLYRSARSRGEAFISPGMKHALRALLPALVAGFGMSLLEVSGAERAASDCYSDVAAHWILFYGLALLATGSFSPRAMQALGAGFFTFGILTWLPTVRHFFGQQYPAAVIFMAASFGMLHIIYAAAVWIQSRRESPGSAA